MMIAPTFGAAETVVPVWPSDAPGEQGKLGKPEQAIVGERGKNPPITRVHNVSKPTLTVYLPPKDKANGAAVMICPGGGYHILAWDLEGVEVAKWLNSIGVAGVVLKYRVPRRKHDPGNLLPLMDAQRGMRLIRQNAKAWNIDPDRVGVLGFSAGGDLTVRTATESGRKTYKPVDDADKLSAKPNFMIPIYAAYLGDKNDPYKLRGDLKIDKQTPPAFLAVTQDDKQRGAHAALFFAALTKAGVKAEVHVYTSGGHGYGLRDSAQPVTSWEDRCGEWLKSMGLLEGKKTD